MKSFVRASALACCTMLALTANRAAASGFSTLALSPDYMTAVTTTPVAAYTNPAALRAGDGLRLFLDASLAYRDASFTRTRSDTPQPLGAAGANTGRATVTDALALPSLSSALTVDDFTFGLGVFLPFGGGQNWDQDKYWKSNQEFVGAVDGPARWHTISGTWITNYITAAAAYELKDLGLSFGASVNAVYTAVELSQAITVQFTDDINNEGRMRSNLSGWTGSFALGTHWEALPEKLWLGLSYQAPPGFWQGQRLEGTLTTRYQRGAGENKQKIHMIEDFPDIIQFGVRARPIDRWELRFSGNYARFSVVRSQCLAKGSNECNVSDSGLQPNNGKSFANFVRRWHDSFGARISNSLFFSDWVETYAALSFDGTAVPNSTLEPALFDGNDIGFTLGTYLKLSEMFTLGASYMHQIMITRDNDGESAFNSFSFPNSLPSANGRYEQWVGVFNVSLATRFDVGL